MIDPKMMDTVGRSDTGECEEQPGVPPRGTSSGRCYDDILKDLVGLCARRRPSEDLVTEALERVVAALGLGGATFSLVSESEGVLHLEPVASAGTHAAFARDMSARPLASLADAATAVADGHAVFSASENGPVGPPRETVGVGRWRSGISAHATAILPVRAWGDVRGVLTIEWPRSGTVDDTDREALEAVADVIGLLYHETGRSEPVAECRPEAGPVTMRTALGITRRGLVVPSGVERHADSDPAVAVSLAARADVEGAVPFWDAIGVEAGRAVLALGVARAQAGGAHTLAETCSHALRMLFVQGARADIALALLADTVRIAAPPGGSVSAVVCSFELGDTSVGITVSAAGDAAALVAPADRRVWSAVSPVEAFGGSTQVEKVGSGCALLIDGDRLVLVSGARVGSGEADIAASIRGVLGARADDGERVAHILDLIGGPSGGGAVMVVAAASASDVA